MRQCYLLGHLLVVNCWFWIFGGVGFFVIPDGDDEVDSDWVGLDVEKSKYVALMSVVNFVVRLVSFVIFALVVVTVVVGDVEVVNVGTVVDNCAVVEVVVRVVVVTF